MTALGALGGVVSSASRAALIEVEQIDGLVEAAGRDGVLDILNAFWRSTDDLVEIARARLACRDFFEALRAAHAIKGSAANVGAAALSEAARALELCCKNTDPAGAEAALERLAAAYAETRTALNAHLKIS